MRNRRTRSIGTTVVAGALTFLGAIPLHAETPTPLATPATPVVAPSATITSAARPSFLASPASTGTAPSASPSPGRRASASDASADRSEPATGASTTGGVEAPVAPAVAPPRVFRTPERAGAPVFVAPDGAGAASDGGAGPAASNGGGMGAAPSAPRARSGLVVFRTTARTALEGFDIRVSYPPDMGSFGTSGRQPDCNAGTGTLVVANDPGLGDLRLLVASASPLPFPLDVFCRFTLVGGSNLDPSAFGVRVAEVTSDGKRADTSLLLVSVAVR